MRDLDIVLAGPPDGSPVAAHDHGRSRSEPRRVRELPLQRSPRVVGVARDSARYGAPASTSRRAPAARRRRARKRRRRPRAAHSLRLPRARAANARSLRRTRLPESAARRSPRRGRRSGRRPRASSARPPRCPETPRSFACSSRGRERASARPCTRCHMRRVDVAPPRSGRGRRHTATPRSSALPAAPPASRAASRRSCRRSGAGSPPPSRASARRGGSRSPRATHGAARGTRAGTRDQPIEFTASE